MLCRYWISRSINFSLVDCLETSRRSCQRRLFSFRDGYNLVSLWYNYDGLFLGWVRDGCSVFVYRDWKTPFSGRYGRSCMHIAAIITFLVNFVVVQGSRLNFSLFVGFFVSAVLRGHWPNCKQAEYCTKHGSVLGEKHENRTK